MTLKANRISIPEWCYGLLHSSADPVTGYCKVIIIKLFENGYHLPEKSMVGSQSDIDNLNCAIGVNTVEAKTMEACSMFNCWQNYLAILMKFADKEQAIKTELQEY